TSGVTGLTAVTSTTLRWTITNGSCSSSDDITLTNYSPATVANAGTDINQCNTGGFTLAGNAPGGGESGLWSYVSGTVVGITTPTSNTSGVTGLTAGTSTTLRWTITNGSCS